VIVGVCEVWWYSDDGEYHTCHHYKGHTGICECECGAILRNGVLLTTNG